MCRVFYGTFTFPTFNWPHFSTTFLTSFLVGDWSMEHEIFKIRPKSSSISTKFHQIPDTGNPARLFDLIVNWDQLRYLIWAQGSNRNTEIPEGCWSLPRTRLHPWLSGLARDRRRRVDGVATPTPMRNLVCRSFLPASLLVLFSDDAVLTCSCVVIFWLLKNRGESWLFNIRCRTVILIVCWILGFCYEILTAKPKRFYVFILEFVMKCKLKLKCFQRGQQWVKISKWNVVWKYVSLMSELFFKQFFFILLEELIGFFLRRRLSSLS